jgi:hypothetical protein
MTDVIGSSSNIGHRRRRWRQSLVAVVAAGAAAVATLAVTPTAAHAAGDITMVLGSGAARYGYGSDDLLVVNAIGPDYRTPRIYYTRGNGGTPFEAWREVPGGGITISGTPAVVRGVLRTYVIVTGQDLRPWIQVFNDEWNGGFWNSGWQQIPGDIQADGVPQATYLPNSHQLLVTMVDVHGALKWQVMDTNTGVWSGWVPANLPTPVERYNGVAVAEVNGKALFAVVGENHRVYAGRFSGWGIEWAEIPGGGRSSQTPAIAMSRDGVVNVFVTGTASPSALWYQSATVTGTTVAGLSWRPGWGTLPGNGQFWIFENGEGPAATRTPSGNVHVYHTGMDNALWTQSFQNPTSTSTALHPAEGDTGWRRVPGTEFVAPGQPGMPTNPPGGPITPPPPPPTAPNLAFVAAPTFNTSTNQFEITLKNFGGTKAGGFQIRREISEYADSYHTITELAAGASTTIVQSMNSIERNLYYTMSITLDPYGAVAESNEGNNNYTFTFFIDGAGKVTYPFGLGLPEAP